MSASVGPRCLFACVVIGIVPFGATTPTAISLAVLIASILGAIVLISRGPPKYGTTLFKVAVAMIAVLSVWVCVQATFPLLGDSIGLDDSALISLSPADSAYSLLFFAFPSLMFLSTMCAIRNDAEARLLLALLGYGGVCFGLYGMLQMFGFPGTNLFLPKVGHVGSLTATFTNRNSAGTLLGLTLLIFVRSFSAIVRRLQLSDLNEFFHGSRLRDTETIARLAVCSFAILLSATSLFLTQSRGAIASTLISIFFLICVLSIRKPSRAADKLRTRRGTLWWVIFGLIVVLVSVLVFGQKVLLRAEIQGEQDARFCVLPGIINLVKDHAIFGYGFGSFRFAFAPYRDPACGLNFVWDRAHSFYLEGAGGLGLLFPVLLAVAIGFLTRTHVSGLNSRRRMRPYSGLGLAALLLVCLHGTVDFSMQIPGLAGFVAVLLAATSGISLRPGKSY